MVKLFGFISLLFLTYITCAYCCTCIPPEFTSSYARADAMFIANITGLYFSSFLDQDELNVYYIATVIENYKNCDLQPGNRVVIRTASNSAACGIPLQIGQTYIIEGYIDEPLNATIDSMQVTLPVYSTNLCTITKLAVDLTDEEIHFLEQRTICCPTRMSTKCFCADLTEPVNCLAAPCSVLPKDCPAEILNCTDNYCGGCTAEFFLEGYFFDEATQIFYQEGQLVNCTTKCEHSLILATTCSQDSDCVVDVEGTSCGCSRNLVINTKFTKEQYLELFKACGEERVTPCDCPPYDLSHPYICADGFCTWNYI